MSEETDNMKIAGEACAFSADRTSGNVVIQAKAMGAEAFDTLKSAEARYKALAHAAQNGMADPRVNGFPIGPYPVNRHGEPLEDVANRRNKPLQPDHPDMQPAAYRIDVPVCRSLM